MRRRLIVTALLATTAAACSASSKGIPAAATHPSRSSLPATAATPKRSTTGAPTTSSTTVPPLPVPNALVPIVSTTRPGEGTWQHAGDRLAGGYGVYTTTLTPAPGEPVSGIAWIDTQATRTLLYAGSSQPYGSWPLQSYVEPAVQPWLIAAFNSGFKIYNYNTGWYDQGKTAVPLQDGLASLVIYSSGSATVGDWGRDVTMSPDVIAVRQNLPLLVDQGAPTPAAQTSAGWGAVLRGGTVTWRSAVGVTSAGDLVYAAGPDLTPEQLAKIMVAARTQRAMELDINPEWVSFSLFTHTGGIGGGALSGSNLLEGMYYSPDHYLQPYSRDFFAVFAR